MAKHNFIFPQKWWLKDGGIKRLSDQAKGILVDLIFYMVEEGRNGYLEFSGTPLNIEQISNHLNRSFDYTDKILSELISKGVLLIDIDNGCYYCPYIRHKLSVSEKKKEIGKKGGNPLLLSNKKEIEDMKEKKEPTPQNTEEVYYTRKGRKLEGKQLIAFNIFWRKFEYSKGKAEAADAWLDLKINDPVLFDKIIKGANAEARARIGLIEKGSTPKMAQGWLSGKRWEDYVK